jgi:hypothetical protein
MPTQPTGVADAAPVAGTVTEMDVLLRPSPDLATTTTADPGTAGTTLAVTTGAAVNRSGAAGGFYIRVIGTSGIAEIMLVTAGGATNSWTVTRGQMGTTGVAHSIGATVNLMVGVQRVEPVEATPIVTFKGRTGTFRIPGRAGTTGQNLLALHNATGSSVLVDVEKVMIDLAQTAAAGVAPTVAPPILRAARFTALPTGGTAPVKVPEDTSMASNASLTLWQDAQTDGVIATTALAVTVNPANSFLVQEFAPRILVVGTSASTFYEPFDRTVFFEDESVAITLRPLEGLLVRAEYTLATQNPTTNVWTVTARWTEYRTT